MLEYYPTELTVIKIKYYTCPLERHEGTEEIMAALCICWVFFFVEDGYRSLCPERTCCTENYDSKV